MQRQGACCPGSLSLVWSCHTCIHMLGVPCRGAPSSQSYSYCRHQSQVSWLQVLHLLVGIREVGSVLVADAQHLLVGIREVGSVLVADAQSPSVTWMNLQCWVNPYRVGSHRLTLSCPVLLFSLLWTQLWESYGDAMGLAPHSDSASEWRLVMPGAVVYRWFLPWPYKQPASECSVWVAE